MITCFFNNFYKGGHFLKQLGFLDGVDVSYFAFISKDFFNLHSTAILLEPNFYQLNILVSYNVEEHSLSYLRCHALLWDILECVNGFVTPDLFYKERRFEKVTISANKDVKLEILNETLTYSQAIEKGYITKGKNYFTG